jgi:hypothetical protein
MSDDRSLERAARSWLEAGPSRAPEHTVQAALDRIESTPQDPVWPFPRIHRRIGPTYRLASAFAVIIAVALGGVLLLQRGPGPGPAISPSASPSSSPSSSPSPSSAPIVSASPSPSAQEGGAAYLTSTFVSPRNGYSVIYPQDWVVTPATEQWQAGVVNQWGSAALDELRGSTARFVGASQLLAPGQTADAWMAAFAGQACITPRAQWLNVRIGAVTGLIDADGCEAPDPPLGKGGPIYDAVVIVDGRAYEFTMDGELSHSDFVAVLATVALDPASALDPTASPQ